MSSNLITLTILLLLAISFIKFFDNLEVNKKVFFFHKNLNETWFYDQNDIKFFDFIKLISIKN